MRENTSIRGKGFMIMFYFVHVVMSVPYLPTIQRTNEYSCKKRCRFCGDWLTIATVLPKQQQRKKNYIVVFEQSVGYFCKGNLLTSVKPPYIYIVPSVMQAHD